LQEAKDCNQIFTEDSKTTLLTKPQVKKKAPTSAQCTRIVASYIISIPINRTLLSK